MSYQNHVIDPTFFYDAIEQFSFNYNLYVQTNKFEVNSYGETVHSYSLKTIRGSLQSQGNKLIQNKSGNMNNMSYEFYCKSLYRINIGDILEYKGNYLKVDSVNDYDEWGVRSCSLSIISLTTYRDLQEYIDYINGDKLV